MLTIDYDETLDAFEGRLLEVVAEVDPALAGPLYVVNKPLATAKAATFSGCDRVHEAEITAAGLWSGRGPCVVIDLEAFYGRSFAEAKSRGFGERRADKLARIALAGSIVHELAHHLVEQDAGGEKELFASGVEMVKQIFRDQMETGVAAANSLTPSEPWAKHDARYIRAVCHLTHRMRRSLPDLKYSHVYDSDLYGVSPSGLYAASLAGELLDSNGSIRTILASAPPAEFRDLWRADIFQWYGTLPQADKSHLAAAEQALAVLP